MASTINTTENSQSKPVAIFLKNKRGGVIDAEILIAGYIEIRRFFVTFGSRIEKLTSIVFVVFYLNIATGYNVFATKMFTRN